ncbi:hypothetical protein CYMTET_20068 [Cymbomonas tetramitiformis]|uniref:Uncharacterized protein n=1 Tax=Cymbomonas tetramitiformis TaxID=36881 RepID=A0AAE0G4T8_9CHLO|nr:hypothetical protein CYMTET_20068 [Cymbomonas tetramitiformis]
MFSDDDEDHPRVSPPTVVGELTYLNGLWRAETPDLWHDAADTLAKMEATPTTLGLHGMESRGLARAYTETPGKVIWPDSSTPPPYLWRAGTVVGAGAETMVVECEVEAGGGREDEERKEDNGRIFGLAAEFSG